jgi:hypothetical protein
MVAFVAVGAAASRSKRVNQSEPVGSVDLGQAETTVSWQSQMAPALSPGASS